MYQQVCKLACDAGNEIMRMYQQQTPLQVTHKADDSPVSAADIAAHQLICHGLHQLTPDIPLLSEEAPPPWPLRQHWQRYWLIDPLDGTREFIHGSGEFTVNIALIEAGQPVFGVVYLPSGQLTYYTAHGAAWKRQGNQCTQIQVRTAHPPVVLISRSYHDAELNHWLAQQGKHQLRQVGSSLKFCLLAEGVGQIYPRFGPTHIWDTAAGHAVAQLAGAQIQDWQGKLLDYTPRKSLLNPGFRAFVPSLANQWREN